jgi:hypothetical protein
VNVPARANISAKAKISAKANISSRNLDALVFNQVFPLIEHPEKILAHPLAGAITAPLTLMKMTRVI